eukprot:gene55122-73641_t
MNLMDATIAGNRAHLNGCDVALGVSYAPVVGRSQIGIRPEYCSLTSGAGLPVTLRRVEDVGRHNALDKLIGMMARRRVDPSTGFALITSRASVEMVQKAAMARMSALVAISAPTATAVRLAEECGLTLVAFARGGNFVCYANSTDALFG